MVEMKVGKEVGRLFGGKWGAYLVVVVDGATAIGPVGVEEPVVSSGSGLDATGRKEVEETAFLLRDVDGGDGGGDGGGKDGGSSAAESEQDGGESDHCCELCLSCETVEVRCWGMDGGGETLIVSRDSTALYSHSQEF